MRQDETIIINMDKALRPMTQEVTSFLNLPVYTKKGIYVGEVGNVILDIDSHRMDKLIITNTNPSLIDGSRDVAVPYRWVAATGDIIILRYFPEEIPIEEKEEEKEEGK